MLRLLVLALMLANGVYFSWTQGLLRAYGFAPAVQNEPLRMAQQLRPEAVHLLSSNELKTEEARAQAEQAPKECLQAGPFDEEAATALRRALDEALPSAAWRLDATQEAARWIVYMGKFKNTEALDKKRAELAGMDLKTHTVGNPALEPGLSLGGFANEAAANTELLRLGKRGIRTARVVQERAPGNVWHLKLPALTEAMKSRLEPVAPALAGKPLQKCD